MNKITSFNKEIALKIANLEESEEARSLDILSKVSANLYRFIAN
jgi:hypothetical protein